MNQQFPILDVLTPTQRAIALLFMEGHTAKEIEEIRFITRRTVATHTWNIHERLRLPVKVAVRSFFIGYGYGFKECDELHESHQPTGWMDDHG